MSDDEVSVFTDADATRLAGIIDDARRAGIHHGNYTLARWILDRWPVEVSTPIASPARVGICGAVAPLLMNGVWTKHCTLPAGHDGWHQDDGEPPMMWSVDGGSFAQQSTMPPAAAPAGEVVSLPPPSKIDSWRRESLIRRAVEYAKEYGHWRLEADAAIRELDSDKADLNVGCAGDALDSLRRTLGELYELGAATRPALADEPAPVPPLVDALLNLVDELHSAVRDDDSNAIDRARGNIVMAVRDMYAAGVADGRRQATDG